MDQDKKYKPMPPISGRFKPGQSGNPKGRPPGKGFKQAMERVLKAVDDSKGAEGAALTDLAMVMYAKSIAGDTTAANMFLDRLEGKVVTQIAGSADHPPLGFAWLDTLAPPELHQIEPPVLEGDSSHPPCPPEATEVNYREDLTGEPAPQLDDGSADPKDT